MDMEEDKTLNAGDDEKMKIALLTWYNTTFA